MATKKDGRDKEVYFELKEHLGILSESNKGWTKELNLVSWNGGETKYDIREWDPDHEKMSKGVTFTRDQILILRDILNGLDDLKTE